MAKKKIKKQKKEATDKVVDILQIISVFGFAFFIAMTGTYVIGQLDGKIPGWMNVLFSLSVVLSAQHVIFTHLDKLGIFDNSDKWLD